jgi:hypothetical protein
VEGVGSKIVELCGLGAVLVAAIPRSEVTGHRRGARISGRQWRALALACGGWRLEYGNARVDEAGTCGWLPRWWCGRSVWQLAGDAATAQGVEVAMERDGD